VDRLAFSTFLLRTTPIPQLPPPFVPPDLTGLSLWLDSSDNSTLTLSGNNVTQWRDKTSSIQFNPSSTTATLSTNPNGVVFPNNSNIAYPSSYTASPNAESLFFVLNVPSFSSNQGANGAFLGSASNGARAIAMFGDSGRVGVLNQNVAWGDIVSTVVPTNRRFIISATISSASGGIQLTRISMNGSSFGSGVNIPTFTSSLTSQLGRQLTNSPINGTIHEVVCYNRVVNNTEKSQVEQYLASKWGIII
jgi:hypothetical protein